MRPAIIHQLSNSITMRQIKYLVVHCTATPQTATIGQIKQAWQRIGWRQPGYHYLITPDGVIHKLLEESEVSNGVKGYNSVSLHISYIGGIETRSGKQVAVDNRTAAQRISIERLLRELRARYPNAMILGHRDLSPDRNGNGVVDPWERIKECPSYDAKIEYRHI